MEVGANKKSLAQLAVVLAVLAVVVYVQFFSGPEVNPALPAASRRPVPAASAPRLPIAGGGPTSRPPTADLPAPQESDASSDASLRKELLERVRAIDTPVVDRNIFNFGRPKPREVVGPTKEEAQLAQAKLEAAVKAPQPKPKPPPATPAPRSVAPPKWKYYGLASAAESETRRAFLLDGDEILLASKGALLQGRYRIIEIGLQAVKLEDTQEDQHFSIPLEFPQ